MDLPSNLLQIPEMYIISKILQKDFTIKVNNNITTCNFNLNLQKDSCTVVKVEYG